jgi:hypothetical protein
VMDRYSSYLWNIEQFFLVVLLELPI